MLVAYPRYNKRYEKCVPAGFIGGQYLEAGKVWGCIINSYWLRCLYKNRIKPRFRGKIRPFVCQFQDLTPITITRQKNRPYQGKITFPGKHSECLPGHFHKNFSPDLDGDQPPTIQVTFQEKTCQIGKDGCRTAQATISCLNSAS